MLCHRARTTNSIMPAAVRAPLAQLLDHLDSLKYVHASNCTPTVHPSVPPPIRHFTRTLGKNALAATIANYTLLYSKVRVLHLSS
jgi:hypothetical protein